MLHSSHSLRLQGQTHLRAIIFSLLVVPGCEGGKSRIDAVQADKEKMSSSFHLGIVRNMTFVDNMKEPRMAKGTDRVAISLRFEPTGHHVFQKVARRFWIEIELPRRGAVFEG